MLVALLREKGSNFPESLSRNINHIRVDVIVSINVYSSHPTNTSIFETVHENSVECILVNVA